MFDWVQRVSNESTRPFVVSLSNHERRFYPSTGFQVTAGTPTLYLSPAGGEIVGGCKAVTDTGHRSARGVALLRVNGFTFTLP